MAASPGIGVTGLRVRVKAKAVCGSDAADTAIQRMIDANRVRRTEGKSKKHYLVESAVASRSTALTTNGVHAPGSVEMPDMSDMV